jgi:aspartyl-tRNA(Asn)/glutamyl-tRNA(Gln) amidotransferase subunit A
MAPLLARRQPLLRHQRRLLRNPSVVNFLDGCALSMPCHHPGSCRWA